jgi:hypothetical protein
MEISITPLVFVHLRFEGVEALDEVFDFAHLQDVIQDELDCSAAVCAIGLKFY